MKVYFTNSSIVFKKLKEPEVSTFSLNYSDIISGQQNSKVNVMYLGDFNVGDKVTIVFEQDCPTTSIMICTMRKSDNTWGDSRGMGSMRWRNTSRTIVATATEECANLKILVSDKTVLQSLSVISGTITIERKIDE